MPRRIDDAEAGFTPAPHIRELESSAVAALVRLVDYWTSDSFQQSLAEGAELQLDARDIPTLFLLGRAVSMRPSELAQALRVSPASVSKSASRLVAAGLVIRLAAPDDGRGSLITLTPEGANAAWSLYDRGEAVFAELLDGWPAEDIAMFSTLLTRFAHRIDCA